MGMVRGLAEIDESMLDLVGGKALNLGVLIRAGFPVPGGFCVTTEAYAAVVRPSWDPTGELDPSALGAVRTLIAALPLPPDLATEILAAYHQLGPAAPVAIRSSATAEDLPGASFAGQQDTELHVVGDEAVLRAVRRCWASLWNDRAVAYRQANGIDHRQVALAVVVQEMVDSSVAGVMFTANPVTGTRTETVIDASPGLGEAVVSGAVNPDHFVVDRTAGAVRERRLGDKRVAVIARPGGGTRQQTLSDTGPPCLDDAQLLELARLGQRVQDHYGAPQDIEWALDGEGRWWLTQARPVTTLYPARPVPEPGLRVLMCLSLAQGLTRPITPMGFAAFRLIGSSVAAAAGSPVAQPLAGPRALHNLGERVFVDFTPVLRHRFGRRLMTRIFGVMEARTAAVVTRLAELPEFAPRPGASGVRPVLGVLLRARVPLRVLTAVLSPRLAHRAVARTEQRLRTELDPGDRTPNQRLDLVEHRLGHDAFLLMPTVFAYALAGFGHLAWARRLLRDQAEPAEIDVIRRGLPDNVTTEMDLELWQLTERIRGDASARSAFETNTSADLVTAWRGGTLPRPAQSGLDTFLRRYGHRAVAEIDLGMPRWSDDPTHLVAMAQNYLQLTVTEAAPSTQFERGAQEADAAVVVLAARAGDRSWLRGRLVGWNLRRARRLLGLREAPKFMLVLVLAAMRTQLARVGAALEEAGMIDRADDVFFLDLGQAREGWAGADQRAAVRQRRATYAMELRRRRVPRVLLSDGTEPEAQALVGARPDGSLAGTPASTGTVTGQARVVLDPVGARLEPGEILVAPSTDPGWTPLFLTAGGLVMEMGGANSHGAVVAREYGIPAVVGVPDATHRLRSGQGVTVDGAAGLVVPQASA